MVEYDEDFISYRAYTTLTQEEISKRTQSIERIIDGILSLGEDDPFKDFDDLTNELNQRLELHFFRANFIELIVKVNSVEADQLFKAETIVLIKNVIDKYENLLNLLSIANKAVAKQNRAKRKNIPDPNQQKARDRAEQIWQAHRKQSLSDTAYQLNKS